MRRADMIWFLSTLLLITTVDAASLDPDIDMAVLMPTKPPATSTPDSWECATQDYTNYFNVPTATGALDTAMVSYGRSLFETCTYTDIQRTNCANPDLSQWCAFRTIVPSTLLSSYSSYNSLAFSWWSSHKSEILSFASDCPSYWYRAGSRQLFGYSPLNDTINEAMCYAEAALTSGSPTMTTTMQTGKTATPGPLVTTSGPASTDSQSPTIISSVTLPTSQAAVGASAPKSTTAASMASENLGYINAWMIVGAVMVAIAANI
ncbi:hypothetical protein GLAREA_12045 [Glarea lozoyensis ATCC 20868]|uniref:DUF7735 domain-containing protein n=1 Tax=Glarea lozoyensis (strain ATCC 20868 / MF5171) TaxID=1116229 RepID=S3E094_GLAL2|nr:uncharacterized protein GLAREA_12045 [Glarea lozoyensis ATCC 20868]EPE31963.1 hypothetical protein GLAREA_12045 [Glarea lozoyensis ATCC 20868]